MFHDILLNEQFEYQHMWHDVLLFQQYEDDYKWKVVDLSTKWDHWVYDSNYGSFYRI